MECGVVWQGSPRGACWPSCQRHGSGDWACTRLQALGSVDTGSDVNQSSETGNGNKQKGNSPAEVRELIASVDGKAGAQLLQR